MSIEMRNRLNSSATSGSNVAFSNGTPQDDKLHATDDGKQRSRKSDELRSILARKDSPYAAENSGELKSDDTVEQLQRLGQSTGGFLDNSLRRQAWIKLLRLHDYETDAHSPVALQDPEALPANTSFTTVKHDVARTTKLFPPGYSEPQRKTLQESLNRIIINFIHRNEDAHYYQGFHEIALTFFLVLEGNEEHEDEDNDGRADEVEQQCLEALERLKSTYLTVFLRRNMDDTIVQLEDINIILSQEDEKLYNFLASSNVGTIYALSWVITWFAHDLEDFDQVRLIYDFCICRPDCLMPIYIAAAILLKLSREVQKQCDCDQASVHSYLRQPLENFSLNWEELFVKAQELSEKYPKEYLAEKEDVKKQNYDLWRKGGRPVRRSGGVVKAASAQIGTRLVVGAVAFVVVAAALFYLRHGPR